MEVYTVSLSLVRTFTLMRNWTRDWLKAIEIAIEIVIPLSVHVNMFEYYLFAPNWAVEEERGEKWRFS